MNDHGSGARAMQLYARAAGLLTFVSLVAGGFGEAYAPAKLIASADAVATARNITTSGEFFRLSFLAYLVEAVSDVTLVLIFYVLLKPVSGGIALLATFFGLIGTTLFAVSEMFYFAAPTLLLSGAEYLRPFSQEQLNAATLFSVKFFGLSSAMFTLLYGVSWILRGYLIIRSTYLPGLIGSLLVVGGAAFAARNVALILAPAYPSGSLLLGIVPGLLLLGLWLLVRGVDVAKWQARAAEDNL